MRVEATKPAEQAIAAEPVVVPPEVVAMDDATSADDDLSPPWDDEPELAVEPQEPEPPVWDDVPMEAAPWEGIAAEREPVEAVAEPVAPPAAAIAVEVTPLGDVWHAVVTQLDAAQAITALVRELALQSQLIAQEAGVWTLRVERASLNQAVARERLAKALAQVTDCTSLQLESGKVTDTPALRNKARAQARQLQAEAIVANDPNVQFLQTTFGATIVPGSIRPV